MPKAVPVYKGEGFFSRNKEFFIDSLNFTTRNLKEIGDFYYANMLMRDYYITTSPEAINHVLVANHKNYIKSPAYNQLKLILGNGLVNSEGEFWRKQRRLAQPAFYKDNLVKLYETMRGIAVESSRNLAQKSRSGESMDISEEMTKVTSDIVLKTLFTAENNADQKLMYESMQAAQEFVVYCMQNPHLAPFTYINGKRRQFYKDKSVFDKKIDDMIEDRRKNKSDAPDLLNMFMEIQDADTGEVMSNQQLRDEIMTMYAAGHETTATALSWTFYLLSQHPEIVEKLRSEVQFVLGNKQTPAFEDLRRMSYTKQVLEESMRLYPPVWSLGRENLAEDEILGYPIPKGSIIWIGTYTLHRDPRFWKNPDTFDPDRFHPDAAKSRPRTHYIPFGAGPRMCIGNHFAMMEMQLLLSTFINHFDFDLMPDHLVVPQPLVSLKPKFGIQMKLKELVSV